MIEDTACAADFPTLTPPKHRNSPINPPQTSHKSFGSNPHQPSTPLTPPNSNKNRTNFPLAFDEHNDDDNNHTSTDNTSPINDVHPTIHLPVSQEVTNNKRSKQRQNKKWTRVAKLGAKSFAPEGISCGCEWSGRCVGQRCTVKNQSGSASADQEAEKFTMQEVLDSLESSSDFEA